MTKLYLLASNTLREVIRQKLFLNILVFGVLMMAFAQVVGQLTFGRADRVVRSIGLSGISLALDLLAILIGVALIHREVERRTALAVLTRPVSRGTFIVGRFTGLLAAVVLASVGFCIVFVCTLLSVQGQIQPTDFVALGGGILEAAVAGALAVLLSCITTPSLGAGIALGFLVAAASIDDVVALTQAKGGPLHLIALAVSYVIPNFARFNFREAAIYMEPPGWDVGLRAVLYAAAFVAAFLILATGALRRKELL